MSILAPYDRDSLRRQFQTAKPFPWLAIDGFLQPEFAKRVADSYPPFEKAVEMGFQFKAVNENKKVQVTNYERFPDPVKTLADTLADTNFLADLSYITGIPDLLWDPQLGGGGMHQTAKSGWLDVHVDFNFHDQMNTHRRLNILVFLNQTWEESWGGMLELWDNEVTNREYAFAPVHNRCVLFETSEKSWHGVTAVSCPPGVARKSFAAYYYTRQAPAGWDGVKHTTIFKPRPHEHMKRHVLMPMSALRQQARTRISAAKQVIKRLISKP
jgi:hypothetical protein